MLRIFCVVLVFLISIKLDAQHFARITYYNLNGITASGERVHNGICAVSRDVEKLYPMGSYIEVKGYGIYKVADRTASWVKNTIDIWSKTPLPYGKSIECRAVQFVDRDYKNYLLISEDELSVLLDTSNININKANY